MSVEDRSRERTRRVGLTAVTSGAATAVTLLTPLITVPLALRYLGEEQYGLFVAITSATALLVVSDLGLGHGLVNSVAEASGRDDQDAVRRDVASTFYLLSVVALGLGFLFAGLNTVVSWPTVFNVSSADASSLAGSSVAVLVVMTLLSVPFSVGLRVNMGYQEGYRNTAWWSLGSLLSLAGLLVAIAVKAPLYWLVFARTIGPLAATVLNGVSLLRRRPWLIPRFRDVSISGCRRIASFGLMFFFIQVAQLVGFQSDNLVVARILGVDAVTQYAIPASLFVLLPGIIGLPLAPLWPAYRDALERGDLNWLKRSLHRSFKYAGLAAIAASALFVAIGGPLIQLWAGPEVTAEISLLIPLGGYATLLTLGLATSMYFYAADRVAFLAKIACSTVVINLAVSIVMTQRIGVAGPAWGSVVALTIALIAQMISLRREIRRLPTAEASVAASMSALEDPFVGVDPHD